MKRVKIYSFIVLALLAAAATMKYANSELSAIAWHLQHGFHAELGGIRIPVPLSYEASDPAGLGSLSMMRLPGLLSHEGGIIDVDFRKLPSSDAADSAAVLQPKGSSRVKKTKLGEREATFAGRQGTCAEYTTEIANPTINGHEIECRFGDDVSVVFMGSAKFNDEFYQIIRTAEPAKAKN